MRSLLYTFSILLLCVATLATAGKLYRWEDEHGNVHYSDKIPPQHIKQARDEMSEKGVATRSVPRAKTAEEIAREQELERLRAEQQRLIAEQQAADRVLLRTFRSEDDIILARNGKIEAIDVMIRVSQSNIRRYRARLADYQAKAATLERSGKAVNQRLLANIDSTLRSINDTYAGISEREKSKKEVAEAFAKDLDRFRELKRLEPKAYTKEQERRPILNLVKCATPESCKAAWARAEAFVVENATTRMQMLSDTIIMTAAPVKDDDLGITVSRIPERDTDETILFMDIYCKESPIGREYCESDNIKALRRTYWEQVGGELVAHREQSGAE